MEIAHLYTAEDIRNYDVKPRNLIVRTSPESQFQVFMIGFECYVFRQEARSEWNSWNIKTGGD